MWLEVWINLIIMLKFILLWQVNEDVRLMCISKGAVWKILLYPGYIISLVSGSIISSLYFKVVLMIMIVIVIVIE